MIRRDDPAGFTLLELLVVLAVLGLVLGIVVTRGPMRSAALELRAASSELAGALRSARARAIVSDRTVLLVIDTATHQYQTGGDPPRSLPWSVAITVTAPANLVAGNWLTGIRFSPDGGSSGGIVVLADGTHRALLSVDWLTGRVSLGDERNAAVPGS